MPYRTHLVSFVKTFSAKGFEPKPGFLIKILTTQGLQNRSKMSSIFIPPFQKLEPN